MTTTNKTTEFTLGGIANDFRHNFTMCLSDKASSNNWGSKIKEISTNEQQDAFYFSQSINFDTLRTIECVYRDIQDTLKSMRELGYVFNVETIKKGYSLEVTNITSRTYELSKLNSELNTYSLGLVIYNDEDDVNIYIVSDDSDNLLKSGTKEEITNFVKSFNWTDYEIEMKKNVTAYKNCLLGSNFEKIKSFFEHYSDEEQIECTYEGRKSNITKKDYIAAIEQATAQTKMNPKVNVQFVEYDEEFDCCELIVSFSSVYITQNLEVFND